MSDLNDDEEIDVFYMLSNRINSIQESQVELSGKLDRLTLMFEEFIKNKSTNTNSSANTKGSSILSIKESDKIDKTPFNVKNLRFKTNFLASERQSISFNKLEENKGDTNRDNKGLFKSILIKRIEYSEDKDEKLDNRILEECIISVHEDLAVCKIHYVQLSLKLFLDVKNIISINGFKIEDLVKEDIMVALSIPKFIVLPTPAKPPDKELLTYY